MDRLEGKHPAPLLLDAPLHATVQQSYTQNIINVAGSLPSASSLSPV